jgi:HTH-type transcriptional regulator, glycine betaine synthesis regulator
MPADSRAPGSGLVLAGEREEAVVAFEAELVDFFVEAAALLGVPKSVAAIYGIVFASPVPLSFAEIEARLDISKGSVSAGLKVLREVGALKEVSKATDRAELFEPDLQMRKLLEHYLQNRLEAQLASSKGRLTAISKAVPGRDGSAEVLRARVRKLQAWHDRSRALLPIIRTFLKLTSG